MKGTGPLRVDAVLPAGGRVNAEFAKAAGAEIKALIRFKDRSILATTVEAIRGACVGRIVTIGPAEIRAECEGLPVDKWLAEGSTGSENVFRGLKWLADQPEAAARAMIVTTDMPFITAEAVAATLTACPADKDICVPLVERTPFEKVYPGLIRTDSRLADGWFRLGGLFPVRPSAILASQCHVDAVFEARKSNLKLARLIGLSTALRYVTRTLTTEHILLRASEILGCSGAVIKATPVEVGFDIDLLEEYLYALRQFEGQ